jgi:protein subunit release factor A
MEISELKKGIEIVGICAWVKPRTIFDLPTLRYKIKDLEQVAAVPTFWDNPDTAQKTLQELNECKSSLETYQSWCEQLEDTKAIIELLELESDRALLEEATDNLTHLQHDLDRWELQQLLNGPYDAKGAVLTINAGGKPMPKIGQKCS